jgi:hypothetical protein
VREIFAPTDPSVPAPITGTLFNATLSSKILSSRSPKRQQQEGMTLANMKHMEEMRNAGKPERKTPLGTRRIWEDNIKTALKETGCDDVYWTHLAQNRDQ